MKRITELTDLLLTESKIVAFSRARNKIAELHRVFIKSASFGDFYLLLDLLPLLF